jgi:nucleoid-associated protein YgaU
MVPWELTAAHRELKLTVGPAGEASPAAGLDGGGGRFAPTSFRAALDPGEPPARLESLVPPPDLPVAFRGASSPPLATGEMTKRPRTYFLRDGDTLESVAQRFLGDRQRAAEIFELNRQVLTSPELLPVGTEIVLPPRQPAASPGD